MENQAEKNCRCVMVVN